MKQERLSICLLVSASIALVASSAAGCSAPGRPTLSPGGPEETVEAGTTRLFFAESSGADYYEWNLQGDGSIPSSVRGDSILFTAPLEGGRIAILTVVAHNSKGGSSPNSITINIPVAAARLDSHGIPAAWMSGRGDPESFIEMELVEAHCHSGPSCQRFTFTPGGVWAGIYWWPADCGEVGSEISFERARSGECGINLLRLGNLTSISRVSLWARGEQGREVVEFKVGGGDILPTPARSSGKVVLTEDWRRYEIPLNQTDLTSAVGLFMWAAADDDNLHGATFYLDDVSFEGSR